MRESVSWSASFEHYRALNDGNRNGSNFYQVATSPSSSAQCGYPDEHELRV